MERKILGVCGDSYMAAVNETLPGYKNHFTEILANKLNWDVVTFARGACSNQAIRLQIDEVIKHKPQFVIIGLTTPERIEFPYDDSTTYDKNAGIYNINYLTTPDLSSKHEGFKRHRPTLRSETITNILHEGRTLEEGLNQRQIKSIEMYFVNLFDREWKRQIDGWIVADGLHKLIHYQIPFYVISSFLNDDAFYFCKDRIIGNSSDLNPWKYPHKNTPNRFHISDEDSIIIAEKWYEILKNELN